MLIIKQSIWETTPVVMLLQLFDLIHDPLYQSGAGVCCDLPLNGLSQVQIIEKLFNGMACLLYTSSYGEMIKKKQIFTLLVM